MAVSDTAPIVAATPAAVARAARLLRGGGLVAFPTETVYGLGANAADDRAVARIFAAKGRPKFNPLIVHVPDAAAAEAIVTFDDAARRLARAFWPGALTLVLPRRAGTEVSLLVSAGLDTVAVRMPSGEVAQALLRAAGVPVAAPSANASGTLSATTAAHVWESLASRVDLILDGGPAAKGIESTVIGFAGGPVLLRPGAIARADIEAVVGPLRDPGAGTQGSPGRLESHYAPRKPLRLDATEARGGEALLAFGTDVPPGAAVAGNLSPSGDLIEAAANLFAMLRALDAGAAAAIAVMPIPAHGLGEAINDRLRRAAVRP
ncbi:MAG TPA: L-threonylcarbamoyladenylate synthase [Rhizomicrobium sp.]|nr:L-threonylcarbamoyladenylate synthase [Rhizomicrobium sp.]